MSKLYRRTGLYLVAMNELWISDKQLLLQNSDHLKHKKIYISRYIVKKASASRR